MMRLAAILLGACAVSLVFTVTLAGQRQGSPENVRACAMMKQALDDSLQIKPGVKRKDVERNFEEDGGLQFPEYGCYTYRACNYIKLEVAYDAAPSRNGQLTSPEDTVRAVSKLFIDYPTKD